MDITQMNYLGIPMILMQSISKVVNHKRETLTCRVKIADAIRKRKSRYLMVMFN